MPNRLAGETSPYLLQHKDNPVDWYEWGEEALERARAEDRPILLSIGYAACHWCHVMEHESFEDAETAELMNEHFVSVKVDREERPDLDALYLDAVVALTGHGGEPVGVLRRLLDPQGGGFGGAPKFPPHSVLELLLRRGELDMVRTTLDGMASGGMHDVVGGGFHRYSVDDQWAIPHFEKMLYDNALLAAAYLHAHAVTAEPRYREVVEDTLGYVLRDLSLPEGGFASSQDA